ncbi:MAG: cytochrome d ubiquinol oxidase subunit II [Candidatus Eisenbacteria bacterium]|nr:cytochrome d ubiquinol oxidase subunit II [Candidatus Eisenbacteria bacterium]
METAWFLLIAGFLIAYVVLDGFDLGAGIVSWLVARGHDERRTVLRAIGPVWNGNEVWIVAAGGALFFAFPILYAASFSGFYLSLIMVLWLLMLRGIGVELRSHVESPLWWSFCDFLFALSGLLLALFYGVAIGNVVRGVPLDADHFFFEPLWTDFRVGPHPGILDWYTVLTGLVAVAALAVHGATYVATKTEGVLNGRARRVALRAWGAVVALTVVSLLGTLSIRDDVMDAFASRPWGWIIPVAVAAALAAVPYFLRRERDGAAFLASAAYLAAMLGGAAFVQYPKLLPSSIDPAYTLTIDNARTGAYSMRVGLIWWLLGTLLAIAYFVHLYRSFRGKVRPAEEGEAY